MPELTDIPLYSSAADAATRSTPNAPPPPDTHPSVAAVQRCCAAYQKVIDERKNTPLATVYAGYAFIRALPHLADHESAMAYIACLTRGMLMNIDFGNSERILLRAVQLFLSGQPREVRPVGRPPKN